MIIAADGEMVFLGLSHENLRRLKNNQPINLNFKDIGFEDREIIIFSGKDENEMAKTMQIRKQN
jgi:hypothetical protein